MRALRPFVAAVAMACALATPASARDVRVALDQAFPIRLSEPAEGVAHRQPSIAGVSVQNDRFVRHRPLIWLHQLGRRRRRGRVLYSGRVVVTRMKPMWLVTRGVRRASCVPRSGPPATNRDGEASQAITDQSRRAAASGGNNDSLRSRLSVSQGFAPNFRRRRSLFASMQP